MEGNISTLEGQTEPFFFTNFPDALDESSLSKCFSQYGSVLDVFVAKKKNKWGKRFGFVQFFGIEDSSLLEAELNGIWLGSFKLRINRARFQRRWEPRKTEQVHEMQTHTGLRSVIVCNNTKKVAEKLSFADAVRSGHENGRVDTVCNTSTEQQHSKKVSMREDHADEEGPDIIITSTREKTDACSRSLVGKVKNVELLRNLFNFTIIEGIADVETFYLGGLYAQLQFQDSQTADNFRIHATEVWRNWFVTLHAWDPSFRVDTRVVVVRALGIPTQSLSESTLTEIGSLWGEVILTQGGGKDEKDRSKGVIGMVVPYLCVFKEKIKLRIDNVDFMVTVKEDEKRTRRMMPEIKQLDVDSSPPSDVDMWDEHFEEEIDEEEVNYKEEVQPVTMENKTDIQSGDDIIVGQEDLQKEYVSLSDNGGQGGGPDHNTTIQPALEDDGISIIGCEEIIMMGQDEELSVVGLCSEPSLTIEIESPCINTTGGGFIVDELSPITGSSCIGSSSNSDFTEPQKSSGGQVSDHAAEDLSIEVNHSPSNGEYPFMSLVDNFMESDSEVHSITALDLDSTGSVEKNRKKNRDFKFKYFADTQCNCRKKKKGVKCHHMINSGNVVNEGIIGQRNDASSGSESYISKANSRLRSKLPCAIVAQNQLFEDNNTEFYETIKLGEKIGFIFSKENREAMQKDWDEFGAKD